MHTEIHQGFVKGLTYKANSDGISVGRVVIEFLADGGEAAEIAALIGLGCTVTLETPQLSMLNRETGELVSR
jgi:hypothetical protein